MKSTIACLLAGALALGAAAQGQPPNIVFLFADDLGWTDLSTGNPNLGNGSGYYRTPNIDALATRGMSFDHAYSNGPNCAPTRGTLMSGQHAARTGIYTVASSNRGQSQFRLLEGAPNQTTLSASVVTLAETLKTAGYATAHFGKWHLGNDGAGVGPLAQGFDVNEAGTASGSVSGGSNGHFARADGSWNLPNLPANGIANQFMAERLTDDALQWMGGNAQGPFFCYLTHFSVHTPIQAPPPDRAAFNGVPTTQYHANQTYAGMLKNLDDQVGRVVTFLETTPDPARPGQMLIANTVVIFYSDNGGLGGYATAGVAGGQEITHQFPLKSGKGSLYEGGIRVPLIVRWDGQVAQSSTNSTPVQSIDFYPTLAAIAGATPPAGQVLDGADFAPVLRGQATGLTRASVFWHFPAYLQASSSMGTWRTTPVSVIRRGDHKLHFYYETRTWELYDLANDIGEQQDLAGAQPGLVQSMGDEMRAWLAQTNAELPRFKNTTTPVPLPGDPGTTGDTVDWQLVPTQTMPTPVHEHVLVTDGTGLLSFGGDAGTAVIDETWRFDGTDWTQFQPGSRPPARRRHAGAFDATRNRLLVFAGEAAGGGLLADTWEFDGVTWNQIAPATSPPLRRDHGLAFDAGRSRVVLFGGRDATATLADTWEFDGVTWSRITPASNPPARYDHGLVCDPATGTTYLFGGTDAGGNRSTDTWRWDGAAWSQITTATNPPARSGFAMAWDDSRGRAVLWGGRDAGGLPLADTWEFDGADWHRRTPAHTPVAADGAAAAFDPGLGRIYLFGGFNGVPLAGTWEYQTAQPGRAQPFGTGCAGTAGTPILWARNLPSLGSRFEVEVAPLPAAPTATFFVIGFSNQTWSGGALPYSLASLGAPTCDLLVAPVDWFHQLAVAGRARFSLAVPNLPRLIGLGFHEQVFAHDPGANQLQFAVSNGVAAVIGGL